VSFDGQSRALLRDLRDFLGILSLESVRILCRYDVEGVSEDIYQAARKTVFSEPQTDEIFDESPPCFGESTRLLLVEALPGQYDQRADSCASCIQLLARGARPEVRTAKLYVFAGDISDGDMERLRGYLINPVESREASLDKPETLAAPYPEPEPVGTVHGLIEADDASLQKYLDDFSLAMDMGDLRFMQSYFRDTERRDPTVAELRVIDTYWSDHCRHTTFNTHITGVAIDDPEVKSAYDMYLEARREVYGADESSRPQTLMDIATIAAKALRSRGLLSNLDVSEEINACSIKIEADVGGRAEDWLLMFKNETHNHPTEVEPFGGAATCIGGAIRDPLSGRAYVYQAMRITGAGDPRAAISDTVHGKLPQRKLTVTAAQGYSSYGNQIGLATGLVHEIYHPGYIAKRMELGAVVGAVKAENVVREAPAPGDKVILLGGRTGRDGIGGATGSSKTHTTDSLVTMASEVQKGNAPEERKIQRLFLDPEVTKMIRRCNDFGAGGVSVAVGELAGGLDIDLSLVRRKYEGLDGTEIAISESQERMAVVVAPRNVGAFIDKAAGENLEAYPIAEVTQEQRLVMRHNGQTIVDLSRDFLSTNGAVKRASVQVPVPQPPAGGAQGPESRVQTPGSPVQGCESLVQSPGSRMQGPGSLVQDPESRMQGCADRLRALARDLRLSSQRGLHEMFDGTVGASGVLMKSGGRTQSTPVQAMAALLPVQDAETTTCSVMAFGFDPYLSSADPFAGARAAVVTSVAKLVAAGCDPDHAYLTFQEYFERLRNDPARWGKPFAALLGALEAQMGLGIAAIGGKDSMSGSYDDLDVPPTLVSFAVAPCDARHVISPEFKEAGHDVVIIDAGGDLALTKSKWKAFRELVVDGTIVSAWAITEGGAAEGIFKMALGNEIGFESSRASDPAHLFACTPGAIVAEVTRAVPGAALIGRTIPEPAIKLGEDALRISELKSAWESTLEGVFPTRADAAGAATKVSCDTRHRERTASNGGFAKPRALIFSFPGTNSEIDTARAVSRAGGVPKTLVVRNLTPRMLEESIAEAIAAIEESQILIIPGGFSFGDEPDGSAKFITVFFRHPGVTDAVHEHLKSRGGLMLGICNGFQALIKLGLVPFGEIVPPDAGSPTLTHNLIGRHQAGYAYTRVASVCSPWMNLCSVGDIHAIALSHGEGRFIASEDMLDRLVRGGQIATQYVDMAGEPSMETIYNPNGSMMAVEGLFSPDGKVFGKMCHTERRGSLVAKNIYGNKHQPVFESGIRYFS